MRRRPEQQQLRSEQPSQRLLRHLRLWWLDVNRVEVFVNGEIQPELSRTRAEHPEVFSNDIVKFNQRLAVTLPEDAFIIVAAIGERLQLGRVMGASGGQRPPVAVSNPIYVSTTENLSTTENQ